MAYADLREKSRYLHEVTKGVAREIREDEITNAEEYADTIIDGKLGKSWTAPNVPKLIEKIADMLGSAKAWEFIQSGQAPVAGSFAGAIKAEGMSLLQMIYDGELGLKLPGGGFDEDYPGASAQIGTQPDAIGTIEIII